MVLTTEPKVTTEILWQGALIFASIDVIFVSVWVWKIKPDRFHRFKWSLVITTIFFWFLIWMMMSSFFWEPVYHYVFPGWARWIVPPVYGILFGAISLLFWWLALRIPGNAVLNFIILGGLLGMLTHIWAISRGILDKPPMLKGASPIAASIMPIFEFIFYWCIIFGITLILDKVLRSGSRNVN